MSDLQTTPADLAPAERVAGELRAEERVERDIFLREIAIVLLVLAVAYAGALAA